jgi:hypothetical protein
MFRVTHYSFKCFKLYNFVVGALRPLGKHCDPILDPCVGGFTKTPSPRHCYLFYPSKYFFPDMQHQRFNTKMKSFKKCKQIVINKKMSGQPTIPTELFQKHANKSFLSEVKSWPTFPCSILSHLELIVDSCKQAISEKEELFTILIQKDLARSTNEVQDPNLILKSLSTTK